MRVEAILRAVLLVEVLAAAVAIAVVLGHGLFVRWRARRAAPALARARDALVALLAGGEEGAAERVLGALRPRRRLRLIAEVAPYVAGETRARMVRLAQALGVGDRIDRRCRSPFWWRRLEGIRLATLCGAGKPPIFDLLEDRNRWVRAQAAAWAASELEHRHMGRLLHLLDDPDLFVRMTAQDALLQIGPRAVEPLARRLSSRRGPSQVAALQVAVGMSDPSFLEPALQLAGDEDPGARRWSALLLGRVGGEAAVARLDDLVDDPDPDVRAAALEGLGRLGQWPAAAHVAERLRDPAWDVRLAAARALRSFGAPGRLLLERAMRSDDPFAADMAHQALDVPALGGEIGG